MIFARRWRSTWEIFGNVSPKTARKPRIAFPGTLETVIEALIRFAHQGHRRDDTNSRRLRFMNAGN
jgi:hypothetical protein